MGSEQRIRWGHCGERSRARGDATAGVVLNELSDQGWLQARELLLLSPAPFSI